MNLMLDWSKRRIVLLTRWLLIIVVSYLIIFSRGSRDYSILSIDTTLILFFLFSNVFLQLKQESFFETRWFDIALFCMDTSIIVLGIYLAKIKEVDFYIILFLEILVIGLSHTLKSVIINATLLCSIYGFFLMRPMGGGGIIYYKVDYLLRIPLLFIVALFYSSITVIIKEKTKEVRSLSERCRLILGSTPDMVFSLDRKGQFTFVSPSSCDVMGESAKSFITTPGLFDNQIHQVDREKVVALISDLTENPKKGESEFRINHLQKGLRWIRMFYAPLLDEKEKQIGIQGSMRDVTELKESQDAVIRSECFISMGRLASSMANEINNPLQAIKNMIYQLENDGGLSKEEYIKSLDTIKKGAQRIEGIVQRLIDIYQFDASERMPIDLHHVLQKAISLTKNRMKLDHIQIKLAFNSGSFMVLGIQNRIYEVFLNIILNAIESMEDGGALSISTYNKEGRVEVLFSDTGHGIAPNDIEHIFEPFFTTKKKSQASGLGLTICYWIIHDMGGDIWVQSLKEAGTTIHLSIPLCKQSTIRAGAGLERCYV